MSFASLGLSEALVSAIEAAGYTQPTPVQQRAIPAALQGRDPMAAAQTGTGKTGGFALPILERLFPNGHPDKSQRHPPRQPRVLVLAPPRELAAQVHESFKIYARDLKFVSACIFGGVGMNPQVQAMARGVDVLVACPDRLLDMGFVNDVKKVLARLPAKRQNLLFSATFSNDITALAGKLLHNPERIEVTPPNTTVERIEQRVFRLASNHKRSLLAHLITAGAWEQVLVFTRTKHGANRLAEYLDKHGLAAVAIHGNKSQNARTKALADFKAGDVRIMVATDIAARGLDIDQLPHVVNFELPNVDEDYVHRIGRTGRAGRTGEAISLVAPDEEKLLKSIERMTKQKIADGDLMGFDSSAVEAEKPEVRERPDVRNPRNPRGPKGDGPNGGGGGGGRRDKGKDKGGKDKAPTNGRGERPAREQKPREGTPAREQRQPSQPPRASADRAPDEFLDDDVDNFGNRVDYVPQAKPAQGRGRRPGAPAQGAGAAAPRGGQPQGGRQNGPRNSSGGTTGTPPAKRSGPRNGAPRDGQARREDSRSNNRRPARDDQPRSSEPAVQNPRGGPAPKIIHKESKADRFPTPEQLDQLPGRPRGEKPALLTRNR